MAEDRPEPAKQTPPPVQRRLSEAAMLALATAVIYFAVGSHQFGYQEQFGVQFLSLSAEELVFLSAPVLDPMLSLAFVLSLIALLTWVFSRENRLARVQAVVMLAYPFVFIAAFLWLTPLRSYPRAFDYTMPYLLAGYLLIDVALWRWVARWRGPPRENVPAQWLRTGQIAIAALGLVMMSYSVGAAEARTRLEWKLCPSAAPSVLVTMLGDTLVCVRADLATGAIFQGQIYFVKATDGPALLATFRQDKPMRFIPAGAAR